MPQAAMHTAKTYTLPPLILHPFSDLAGPNKLVESSRATLMLQGLLPSGELSEDDLHRRVLDGRYCEIRMLFYVGKDVLRWIEQCLEFVARDPELRDVGIRFQSFAALLTENPPQAVRAKLRKWGVADYKAIFTRAMGLNAIFGQAPDRDVLSDDFIRNYYRYCDYMFGCHQLLHSFTEIHSANFNFDLYASGEYSRILEKQWESDSTIS